MPDLPGLADVSPLGHGGFADVLLGRQIHLERWVAAKVFRVTLADAIAADRFRAECRTLGKLDQYPHVITVHDAGVLPDGRPYLISERCDGSLADLIEMRGTLPVDRAVEIFLTMARALLFAHSCGVVHGDVTPRNVLLRSSGAPVLADFGMAVLREHRDAPAAGYTADHAAPETVSAGAVDEAADVFGLGSTLVTVLSGHPPYPSAPSGEPARLTRIEAGPPALPPAPPWLAGLLSRMLAADPACRPSVDEVVTTLAAGGPVAIAGTMGRPAAPLVARRLDDDPTSPTGMPVTGAESTRLRGILSDQRTGPPREAVAAPFRTRIWAPTPWLIVAAAAVLCVGAGVGWFASTTAPAQPSSSAVPATSAPAAPSFPAVAAPVQPTVDIDPPAPYGGGGSETPRTARRTAAPNKAAKPVPVTPQPAPVVPVTPRPAPIVVPPPSSVGLPINSGGNNGGNNGGDGGDGGNNGGDGGGNDGGNGGGNGGDGGGGN